MRALLQKHTPLLLMFGLILAINQSIAAEDVKPKLKWASLSGGPIYGRGSAGLGMQFQFTVARRPEGSPALLYKAVSLTMARELTPVLGGKRPVEHFQEIDGLIGIILDIDPITIALGTGIGYAWGIKRSNNFVKATSWLGPVYFEEDKISAIGVPLQIDAYWSYSKYIALGVSMYNSFNGSHPMLGFTAGARIGRQK